MSDSVKIFGGIPLVGEITPVPNKNAILACLPACILTDEPMIYRNIPKTTDVEKMFQMLRLMGATIDDSNYDLVTINCSKLTTFRVDKDLGSLIRSSIMFAGPLLARFGKAEIPVPGGCVLGKRSISAHIDVFTKAGVRIDYLSDGYVRFIAPKKQEKHYRIWQFEASVTGTENLLLYAAGINSNIELTDAACEVHVQELETLLTHMGATIQGIGSNKITTYGKNKLNGTEYLPGPDFVDIGGLSVAAAITKGRIVIKNGNVYEAIGGIIDTLRKFNIKVIDQGNDLIIDGSNDLYIDAKTTGFPLAGEDLPKFVPRPWPGFPVDLLPVMVVLACKTKGRLMMQNWMYETGLDFIRELGALGANIYMSDPQRIIVSGPINFTGGKVVSPGVIQACKAIFLAGLADPVTTTIHGVEILKRRYPAIFDNYRKLGAKIEGPTESHY